MKNLFDAERVDEIKGRLAQLRPDSPRQWGKMNPGQAAAHCSGALEIALGDRMPTRLYFGRVLGALIKPMVLKDDAPMRRNAPTPKGNEVEDDRDLGAERERLRGLIDRFAATGPKGCTQHPHSYFGRLTPDEWSILMYKHLDHHLRQFSV